MTLPIQDHRFASLFLGQFGMRPRTGQIEIPIVTLGKKGSFHVDQGVLRPRNARRFVETVEDLFTEIPHSYLQKVDLGEWGAVNLAGRKLIFIGSGGESIEVKRGDKGRTVHVKLGVIGMFSGVSMLMEINTPRSGLPKVQVTSYEIDLAGPAILNLLAFLRLGETAELRTAGETALARLGVPGRPKFIVDPDSGESQAGGGGEERSDGCGI